MRCIIILIISSVIFLSSCGSKLNPEWYPHGAGKDTVYTLGNGKFFLGKTIEGTDLSMFTDDGHCGVILAFVNKYKKINNSLYVYSDEGYCVIDENQNKAKVLITVEKQHVSNLVGEDSAISYLSSFEEFSKAEQDVFNKLKLN